jgi:hypothetical protein
MLIVPDEIVTGALVNAIAVVGRQISKAASGLREPDGDLMTARWFETFRLTGALPDLPDLSAASWDRIARILTRAEIQAALQELLAARLTDAPETDASRARDAVHVALNAVGSDTVTCAEALADYYDDQICALVARLEAQDPPLLTQIRGEAFSARIISALHAIERNTAALADREGQRASGGPAVPAGRLLAEVVDPFTLEVHRPVQAHDPPSGLPVLPAYMRREHDGALAAVAREATAGTSGIAVLVGGSSTGKTRACWEMLALLRDLPQPWRLCHPIDPSRPEAALRELPSIGPRTVVWLNEAQFYLDAPANGRGEQVAAGLRELLRDPARAPVLVLATLWPEFWDVLTARPPAGVADSHAQARELLAGRDISVPGAFTAVQLRELSESGDPRLALAAVAAEGQVVQFLAGARELLARYRNAPPAAKALINAAMDARRLGIGFLEAAAPGYLTDIEWDGLGEDWLTQTLGYTVAGSGGIHGPLTRIRPRPSQSGLPIHGAAYRLADYLDQYGRQARRSLIPPAEFWTATTDFAAPGELAALAGAAVDRGLLRIAAGLRKIAAERGDTIAAAELVISLHLLNPADSEPGKWAAAHASLDDPGAVATLLEALREAGATGQAEALLARDPAAHATLDDPGAVAHLLSALRKAGATGQAEALAARAAQDVSLDGGNLAAPVELMRELREAGAAGQAEALMTRFAADHRLDSRPVAGALLGALMGAGIADLAGPLAARFAVDPRLDAPQAVADGLNVLLFAGAADQAEALLARDPAAHATLDDPGAVAHLLSALREAGATGQAEALLARDPAAHATLDDPGAVAALLGALREAGATGQAEALLARDPAAHATLDDPGAVAALLGALREAGAASQAEALVIRTARDFSLDNLTAPAELLGALWEAGAVDQAKALASRIASHTSLDNPWTVAQLLAVLREAGADEVMLARNPAAHATLDDPGAVATLLGALRDAGATGQAEALLTRNPAAHATLNYPDPAAALLRALREAGAVGQAEALVERLPAEGLFRLFNGQGNHREAYIFGREQDGRAASKWSWGDLA